MQYMLESVLSEIIKLKIIKVQRGKFELQKTLLPRRFILLRAPCIVVVSLYIILTSCFTALVISW